METETNFTALLAMEDDTKKKIQEFEDLLATLSSSADKQKSLWLQIYQNALMDRTNSYLAWTDLYAKVHGNPTEHAIHGQNLSRYLERMSKANDQLIKLAELINNAKTKEDDNALTEDELYSQLESSFVSSKKQ